MNTPQLKVKFGLKITYWKYCRGLYFVTYSPLEFQQIQTTSYELTSTFPQINGGEI